VHLKATGAEEETLFSASISAGPLLAEKTKNIFYLKASYPRHPETVGENHVSFGQSDIKNLPPQFTEKDFFAITLASKRISP
jgi:hypothetical protein